MKLGDLVIRKSYGGDLIFKIEHIIQQKAIIKGVNYRLLADSPLIDLQLTNEVRPDQEHDLVQSRLKESVRVMQQSATRQKDKQTLYDKSRNHLSYFEMPGKILHLDGDPSYLRKSMNIYGELRIPAEGIYVPEMNMSQALYRLLPQARPDIVVITGHDGILKYRKNRDQDSLGSYKNSQHFVDAVKIARQYERNRDSLIVIAGACQSHFEALLQAGANFASSPSRVLIHALDPVAVATKVSFTSIKNTLNIHDVISHTISGLDGLGGIETRGCHRMGYPKITKVVQN